MKCPHCGKEISDYAVKCPNSGGYPKEPENAEIRERLKKKEEQTHHNGIIPSIVAIIVTLLIGFLADPLITNICNTGFDKTMVGIVYAVTFILALVVIFKFKVYQCINMVGIIAWCVVSLGIICVLHVQKEHMLTQAMVNFNGYAPSSVSTLLYVVFHALVLMAAVLLIIVLISYVRKKSK